MMKKQRILLVEDEESLVDVIQLNLELEGYEVAVATDGQEALRLARGERFDLCVLDIMLPKLDGFAVCKTLRLENNRLPVLFLSAKSTGADRVEGLRIGGDDYLTKPFNLEELLLRISNLIRRSDPVSSENRIPDGYTFGGNTIYFSTYEVKGYNGDRHDLSKKEMALLRFLIENEGKVVSREIILSTVWGYDVYPSTRTIDNFILSFRKYFESNPRIPRHFHSIRGVGYKFLK
jgi:two-component system alkaline phosphatase synthesis response regulator PhoP